MGKYPNIRGQYTDYPATAIRRGRPGRPGISFSPVMLSSFWTNAESPAGRPVRAH